MLSELWQMTTSITATTTRSAAAVRSDTPSGLAARLRVTLGGRVNGAADQRRLRPRALLVDGGARAMQVPARRVGRDGELDQMRCQPQPALRGERLGARAQ